jgi:hypothetical protein
VFVAAGQDGKGAYSTDGVNWTPIGDMKFGTSTINALAWGGGVFVAVGGSGKGAYGYAETATVAVRATGDISAEGDVRAEGAVTAGRIAATGGADITGTLYTSGGVLTSSEWSFTNTTQNDWFQKFVNIIPIGKSLQVKGLIYYRYDVSADTIACLANIIARINTNTIEIRCINISGRAKIQNITCTNGNSGIITNSSGSISW